MGICGLMLFISNIYCAGRNCYRGDIEDGRWASIEAALYFIAAVICFK